MRTMRRTLWTSLAVLLALPGYGGGDDYAILYLHRPQGQELGEVNRVGETYRDVRAVDKADIPDPLEEDQEDPDYIEWVFWDASSVSFKMGVPTEDLPSQYTATGSIQNAISSWDDIEDDSLSVTYAGVDLYKANDPKDRVNVIFWSDHSSIHDVNGYTLITTPVTGINIGEFLDVDIVLNEEKRWTTGLARCRPDTAGAGYVDTVDVESVVAHELGHALGLGHSTGTNTMTSSADWCDHHASEYRNLEQRTLASGDVDGYEFIYVDGEGIRATFGNDSASKIVAADPAEIDLARAQATVFPNPFNPEVTLTFQLEHSATVSVHIYDELGQLVRVLARKAVRSPGQYQYVWDGLDDDGRSEASGVYFLVLSIDGVKESRKLTLLH